MRMMKFIIYPILGAILLPLFIAIFCIPVFVAFFFIDTFKLHVLYVIPIVAVFYGTFCGLLFAIEECTKQTEEDAAL